MTLPEISFWLCLACIFYTYALYPLAIALAARQNRRVPLIADRFAGSVSILIPAYNEESCIVRRIDEFTAILAATGLDAKSLSFQTVRRTAQPPWHGNAQANP